MRIYGNHEFSLVKKIAPYANIYIVLSDHPPKEHIHTFRRGCGEQAWDPGAMPEHLTQRMVVSAILVHDHLITNAPESLIDQPHGLT